MTKCRDGRWRCNIGGRDTKFSELAEHVAVARYRALNVADTPMATLTDVKHPLGPVLDSSALLLRDLVNRVVENPPQSK